MLDTVSYTVPLFGNTMAGYSSVGHTRKNHSMACLHRGPRTKRIPAKETKSKKKKKTET